MSDKRPVINTSPPLPSMSAREVAMAMLYMDCRRCGFMMERGSQCPRCGAWCR